jgi:hypothetical protein
MPVQAPVRNNNRYAVFEVEDEVEVKFEVKVEEFPLLGGKSAAIQETSRVSYAKAFASKPAQVQAPLTKCVAVGKKQENICHKIVEEEEEQLTVEEQYGERMYEILYEYFKNDFHRERTSTVVDRLLDCSTKERLEEFMSNRLYLEDCADEIFMALKEFDPPAQTPYRELAEDNDW